MCAPACSGIADFLVSVITKRTQIYAITCRNLGEAEKVTNNTSCRKKKTVDFLNYHLLRYVFF